MESGPDILHLHFIPRTDRRPSKRRRHFRQSFALLRRTKDRVSPHVLATGGCLRPVVVVLRVVEPAVQRAPTSSFRRVALLGSPPAVVRPGGAGAPLRFVHVGPALVGRGRGGRQDHVGLCAVRRTVFLRGGQRAAVSVRTSPGDESAGRACGGDGAIRGFQIDPPCEGPGWWAGGRRPEEEARRGRAGPAGDGIPAHPLQAPGRPADGGPSEDRAGPGLRVAAVPRLGPVPRLEDRTGRRAADGAGFFRGTELLREPRESVPHAPRPPGGPPPVAVGHTPVGRDVLHPREGIRPGRDAAGGGRAAFPHHGVVAAARRGSHERRRGRLRPMRAVRQGRLRPARHGGPPAIRASGEQEERRLLKISAGEREDL
mmetsp:Transcript_3666/g.7603  ORF Transcript_3666/g.7603 Transcript_3666/m.7603 type:complete len:372 (-) Transcript_3666:1058-2173(-)